ncbi:MAG: ribonuclease HII [Patescibacteria group bacterium]
MGKIIVGLDEAGRGPVAGPIVGAAVLTDGSRLHKKILAKVKDSKVLTAKQRQHLFILITENFPWAVHAIDNKFIDRYGIQASNVLVLEKSCQQLLSLCSSEYLLVSDYVGGAKKYLTTEQVISFYKHGENKFKIIAAASIVAKVYRDNLLINLHQKYPDYNFIQHKGYGTKQHLSAIKKYGPSPIHRRSFLKNYL